MHPDHGHESHDWVQTVDYDGDAMSTSSSSSTPDQSFGVAGAWAHPDDGAECFDGELWPPHHGATWADDIIGATTLSVDWDAEQLAPPELPIEGPIKRPKLEPPWVGCPCVRYTPCAYGVSNREGTPEQGAGADDGAGAVAYSHVGADLSLIRALSAELRAAGECFLPVRIPTA
jgi:hypothetical protein